MCGPLMASYANMEREGPAKMKSSSVSLRVPSPQESMDDSGSITGIYTSHNNIYDIYHI